MITNATLLGGGAGLLFGVMDLFICANPVFWLISAWTILKEDSVEKSNAMEKGFKKLMGRSGSRILLVPTAAGALIANSVLFAAKKGYEFEFKSSTQDEERRVNSLN